MKKLLLAILPILGTSYSYGQLQVITTGNNLIDPTNPYAADIVIGSDKGTRHDASIMWWSAGSASRISNTNDVFNFSVWNTTNPNVSLTATVGGASYFQGNLGLGTNAISPTQRLDVEGNLLLRNYQNVAGGGASILFSAIGDNNNPGSRIRNYLEYGDGTNSHSRLILESFYGSYKQELTLTNGRVGINNINPTHTLDVNGQIHANEILVDANTPTPDYVFDKDYDLATLKYVKTYIDQNHHLPEIPSATQVAKEGINLGEMNTKLLKKVEELTLYLIQQKEDSEVRLTNQQVQIDELKKQIKALSKTK